jgi:hypothetical protein
MNIMQIIMMIIQITNDFYADYYDDNKRIIYDDNEQIIYADNKRIIHDDNNQIIHDDNKQIIYAFIHKSIIIPS